ncbi:hypothetical protein CRENBAI_009010 [Crenichthys baileyi]|uniref:Uncharacterized protein n=1 Tax=Crenichthys baileyi TaxID=28760 RepID=A0AAV9S7L1_9TELE
MLLPQCLLLELNQNRACFLCRRENLIRQVPAASVQRSCFYGSLRKTGLLRSGYSFSKMDDLQMKQLPRCLERTGLFSEMRSSGFSCSFRKNSASPHSGILGEGTFIVGLVLPDLQNDNQ